MSLRINHNISATNSHRNLLVNESAMSKTLERLSSGLKINRAADGPAALVISEQMRAQIAGLGQAIDNSETAISMVQTTEANLGEVSTLLTSIRQLIIHAANEGVNDETMLAADQLEIDNALETIDRIAKQAQFGNKKLLDGTNGAQGSTTGADLDFVRASLETTDSSKTGFDVRITQNASRANVEGAVGLTQEMVAKGEVLTVIEDGKTATYTTNENDTTDTAIKNLESEIIRNGLQVDVQMDQTGKIKLVHKNFGSDYEFQVSSSTAGVLSSVGGEIETAQAGKDIKGTINGESATGKGQILTGIDGAQNIDGLSIRFKGMAGEGGNIPPEGVKVGQVFVSQNSLNFQVGANHNQTVGISIANIDTNQLAKGVDNDSKFKALSDVDVTTFNGAQDSLLLVDKAIDEVTKTRGEIGAFQKNTLESNLSNLRVANENLISSESVLRDLDMAKEMADFTKHQIMTQSATAMLAQANQTPATVLQLLK